MGYKYSKINKKWLPIVMVVGLGHVGTVQADWFSDAVNWVETAAEDTANFFTGGPQAVGYVPLDGDNPVHSLAQGCFSIQSPHSDKFVKRYYSGGLINDGQNYGFHGASLDDASRFYFKPTRFDYYMMTDQDDRYLAARLPIDMTAGTYAGKFAEWKTTAIEQGDGQFLYQFRVTGLDRTVRNNYSTDSLYFIDLLNPLNLNSETDFRLVPQTGCKDFPEIATSVTGSPEGLKGDVRDPVRGFIDAHTHITSYEFMGGKFMHGKPFHRFGVESALNDSKSIHGDWGALDIIGNLQAYGDVNYRYDTRGYPDFPHWPNHKQMSHMGYYYKWMERAYLGGQRMIVSHVVENEVLCNIQATVNPASWINPNSCNTMDSIRLQIQRLNEIQTYVDVQTGGHGKGFFRLVTSPEEAREVIADGKLAVLIGVEASETFNCGEKDGCSQGDVERQLNELYDLGVRVLFPVHKFDNKFGGSVVEDGLMNAGEWISTGHFFDTQECDADTHGPSMTSGFPVLGGMPVIGDVIDILIPESPNYVQGIEHCNKRGLSEMGAYLVNRMIDKKMLIEMDHMSDKAGSAVLDIVELRNYSGVISSHSWMPSSKNGEMHNNLKRVVQTGGFVSLYNGSAHSIADGISRYLDEVETTDYLAGITFATDMSGLGNQPGPRDDATYNPLNYPFTTEFGLVMDKQQSGNRSYDLNNDGMAHYGMVADHVQDIREQASGRIYESVMNSAEAYLQMWERSEANTSYVEPVFQQFVDKRAGLCMNLWGGAAYDGADVRLYNCSGSANEQWTYEVATGLIRSKLNSAYCLDMAGGSVWDGGNVQVWSCISGHPNMTWDIVGDTIRPRMNHNYAIDAYGASSGHNIGLWSVHGGSNQSWTFSQ